MTDARQAAPGVYAVKNGVLDVFVTEDQLTLKREGVNYCFHTNLADAIKAVTAGVAVNKTGHIDKGEKYMVTIRNRKTGESIKVDVYDVLEAFKINCSAMAHAIKKFLMAGKRGVKGYDKDCDEGINSVEQSKLLEQYRVKEGEPDA